MFARNVRRRRGICIRHHVADTISGREDEVLYAMSKTCVDKALCLSFFGAFGTMDGDAEDAVDGRVGGGEDGFGGCGVPC